MFAYQSQPPDHIFLSNSFYSINPMNNRKFSTALVAIVIAFLSIYAAATSTFTTNNNTSQPLTVTLQLQSGAQSIINVAPLSQLPTQIGSDQVVGLSVFGMMVPAGATVIVPNPSGGSVTVSWGMSGNAPSYTKIDPNEIG